MSLWICVDLWTDVFVKLWTDEFVDLCGLVD